MFYRGEAIRIGSWLLAASLLLWASMARAEQLSPENAPFDLIAEEVEYDRARALYVARGKVRIEQQVPPRVLHADWVTFSSRTGQGVASGEVIVEEGPDVLTADFMQFRVDDTRGIVFHAELDSGEKHFRMEGSEVSKTGESTYHFQDGRFTTCRCPDEDQTDPWHIEADEADVTVGGYAVAKNTTFEVLGIPILWVPWVVIPVKTDRQTGFLPPLLNASSRGTADFSLPFFWAPRDELNVLFTPTFISGRGFKPKLELEYVFGEASEGALMASYIDDHRTDPPNPSTPFDTDRWAFGSQQDWMLARWGAISIRCSFGIR